MMCFRFCCAVLCALLLGGCKTTKTVYVPTETASVRTDSAATVRVIDRLIIERDTVSVRMSGDTLVKETVKWRVREVTKTDTVFRAHTDTLRVREPYPVEVVKKVERRLHWWQTALMWSGGAALIGICIAVWWLIRRRK